MKTVKSPQFETIEDFKALEGVIAIETHLYRIGPISYPAFLKAKEQLDTAVNALNACFLTNKHFEALCMEFPSYMVLCVRDTRKNVSYFEKLEEVPNA